MFIRLAADVQARKNQLKWFLPKAVAYLIDLFKQIKDGQRIQLERNMPGNHPKGKQGPNLETLLVPVTEMLT